ncbi:phage protein Gp37 [Desulfovulcanus sp.]
MAFEIEIENEMVETLKRVQGVRTVRSYGGEFSPDSIGQELIQYPAILPCVVEAEFEPVNLKDKVEPIIKVYLADKNLRGQESARRGDATSVGVYYLQQEARKALNRKPILGGVLFLKKQKVIYYSKSLGLCVAEQIYTLKLTVPINQ